jgi:hypothetical protein
VKELQGRASAGLDVPPERCYELVAAVNRYPAWFNKAARKGLSR